MNEIINDLIYGGIVRMKNYDRVHKGLIIYGKESIIFGNEGELL